MALKRNTQKSRPIQVYKPEVLISISHTKEEVVIQTSRREYKYVLKHKGNQKYIEVA